MGILLKNQFTTIFLISYPFLVNILYHYYLFVLFSVLLIMPLLIIITQMAAKTARIFFSVLFLIITTANVIIWLQMFLLFSCWDVEVSPGSKKNIYIYIYIYQENFSICHWNLNTFLVHNYAKLWLFKGYVNCHNFDIVYLSESYLDSLESVSATLNCLVTN